MKKLLKSLLVIVSILMLTSYSANAQSTKRNINETLASAKTYAFYIKEKNQSVENKLNNQFIVNTIEKEMQKKGLTESENPDLLVVIDTQYIQNTVTHTKNYGSFYGESAGDKRSSYRSSSKKTTTLLTNCHLDVEFINAKNNILLSKRKGLVALGSSHLSISNKNRKRKITELVNSIL